MREPFLATGEPTAEFAALLKAGRQRGYLTPDDLMDVLQGVELRPEVISAVVGRVQAEGIEWRDPGVLLSDEGLSKLAFELVNEHSSMGPARAAGGGNAPQESGPGFLRRRQRATGGTQRLSVAGVKVDLGVARAGGADSVRAYLREIGRVKLLTADQEVALAKWAERGRAAAARLDRLPAVEAQLNGCGPAARAARRRALKREREADERLRMEGVLARQALVEANLRLVVSVAKWYRNRGLAFLDLIQEGNLGLMRAVERFDPTKGFKFSTYATWWIRQAMSRAIADQARTIRIPVHVVDNLNAVLSAQRALVQELGREPTVQEVADRADMSPERVREVLRVGQGTISLEQPLGEDDFSLYDTLEDSSSLSPADAADAAMLREALAEVLAGLSEREQRVVRLRFGLEDGQARTLEEVSREFGVTRERVRQIESKSLAKLRQPLRRVQLQDYLGS